MNNEVLIIGYRSGIIAFAATVAYYIVQMLQVMGYISYPFDEILIYGTSLCITIPFIIEMLALHYSTKPDKMFWSHLALLFTVMYGIFVIANYVVQLATVIPMTLNGTSDEIKILKQTPHSLFWDFDAIGYIFMGIATFCAIPVFEKQGFQKVIRIAFLAHALTTPLIAFVYFYPSYSDELLFIATPWAITAPLFMLLLAIMFKKRLKIKTG